MAVIFAFLLFSLLIFVHELGHFLAAKASGVQVNEFSIFMGPAIYKKQVGETLYAIRCIPIGGYCAMEGEDEGSDNPRAFGNAKWWKRLIILVAGSFMNFVAGLLILVLLFAPAQNFISTRIDYVEPGSSLAEGNGLMAGDRLLEIDGEKIFAHSDFTMIPYAKGTETHDIVVERNGQRVLLEDVVMELREFTDPDGTKSSRYGLTFGTEEATLGTKLRYSWNVAMNYARSVKLSIEMIINGKAGFKDLSGPVGIVEQMSQTAAASETVLDALLNMLSFGALIAVNLAVMNLLPLPALDGGRVVCLLLTTVAEAVLRRKLNPKYEGYLHMAGMVLLLLLTAVIMFKDIIFLFI